jgi:hypothetical protein
LTVGAILPGITRAGALPPPVDPYRFPASIYKIISLPALPDKKTAAAGGPIWNVLNNYNNESA